MVVERDIEWSLDNIQLYLLPKLRSNVGAHRTDSVMALAMTVCDAVDSAIVMGKNNDAAELAVMYQSQQQKEQ